MNERQKLFIAEYVCDFNATQAAIRAGYSERSAYQIGHALLKDVDVSRALREAIKERTERLGITADDVLLRAMQIYERAMQAEPVMKWDPEKGEFVATGEYQFDSKGANKALELIGKLLGAFIKEKPGDSEGQRPFIIQINNSPRGQDVRVISPPAQALPAPAIRIGTQPKISRETEGEKP